jgi:hypothetical protein
MKPFARYGVVGTQFIRQWKLLVLIRHQPRTIQWLARELNCAGRTVHRDLAVLQAAGIPIVQYGGPDDPENWLRQPLWCAGEMPEWPKREPMPMAPIIRRAEASA